MTSDELNDLLGRVGFQVNGVQVYRLHAELSDDVRMVDQDITVTPTYAFRVRSDPGTAEVRMRVEAKFEIGAFDADVAIRFDIGESIELNEEQLRDFAITHGFPQVIPFLRESVADVTRRVFGSPFVFPMTTPSIETESFRVESNQ